MLHVLKEQLKDFNKFDLLKKVGALHLIPDNAFRAFSLDAFTHLIASQPSKEIEPTISIAEFTDLLRKHFSEGSRWARHDDPPPQLFTEEIPFHQGPYIVFPGPTPGIQDIVSWMLIAIKILDADMTCEGFCDEAIRTAILCLTVSHQIALKANLSRGCTSSGHLWQELVVPDAKGFQRGANAVTFANSQLSNISYKGSSVINSLDLLTTDIGSVEIESYTPEFGQLHHRPFIQIGEHYIVPSPSLLLTSLLNRILRIAHTHDTIADLANAYRQVVWHEIHKCMALHRSLPAKVTVSPQSRTGWQEGFFCLDTDKLVYVQLITDDLEDMRWPPETPMSGDETPLVDLQLRTHEVVAALSELNPAPAGVLILTILQPVHRERRVILGALPKGAFRLHMSVSDLRSIVRLESNDELCLWKFARAKYHANEVLGITTSNQLIDTLDEYAHYRTNDYSYFSTEYERPLYILILPHSSRELREEEKAKCDLHLIPSFEGNQLLEVQSAFGSETPISKPLAPKGQPALVVEGSLPIPLWIIGPAGTDPTLEGVVSAIVQIGAYWIWQCAEFIIELLESAQSTPALFVLEMWLDDPIQWRTTMEQFHDFPTTEQPIVTSMHSFHNRSIITLHHSLLAQLRGPTNEGERRFMKQLLTSIAATIGEFDTLEDTLVRDIKLQQMMDSVAPFGSKKVITIWPQKAASFVDEPATSPLRLVQHSEFDQIFDDAGQYLKQRGWSDKNLKPEDAQAALNHGVTHLFQKLEKLVRCLDQSTLLATLVAYQEDYVQAAFASQLEIPGYLPWAAEPNEVHQRLVQQTRDRNNGSIANRFLIEYVVARPPSGDFRFSFERYDRLLALSSSIIHWGTVSDVIHYELGSVDVGILPSGRLGIDGGALGTSYTEYVDGLMSDTFGTMQREFSSFWEYQENSQTKMDSLLTHLDSAFQDDVGLKLSDLWLFVQHVINLGDEQTYSVKQMPLDKLTATLSESLHWSQRTVELCIELMALSPRKDFFKTRGHSRRDVYPWRSNRSLSYLRRPLLLTESPKGDGAYVLWGNRQLVQSFVYLVDLCDNGKLKTKCATLKKAIGKSRNRRAKLFEANVGEMIKGVTGFQTKVSINKVGRRRIGSPGDDLGDIDVLGVIPEAKMVLAVECKDLSLASTPADIQRQLQELVDGFGEDTSTVFRHLKRIGWLESNLEDVLAYCWSISLDLDWVVQPLLVSNTELPIRYLRDIPFPFLSVGKLRNVSVQQLVTVLKNSDKTRAT